MVLAPLAQVNQSYGTLYSYSTPAEQIQGQETNLTLKTLQTAINHPHGHLVLQN